MDPNPTPAKPEPRRWFRFSIRSLLLFTALVAVWLGYETRRVAVQREAVAAIYKHVAAQSWDRNPRPGGPKHRPCMHYVSYCPRFVWSDFDNMPAWARSWAAAYRNLWCDVSSVTVGLPNEATGSRVSDELLGQLRRLPALREVAFWGYGPRDGRDEQAVKSVLPNCRVRREKPSLDCWRSQ
ncbi:MAG: hypothetical protein K8T25_01605 [Planctomycetia bacterium]|nr:hypothetical protein [Planctomycetia bacterium]